ncbi:MAG: T9SS type A sorting domain-containing protein [Bacteroidetes bacterium]|nr:T9SS type A sorting domain-containing protein [Bacteroidota bacterium]
MPLFITELPQPPIPVVLASGDTLLCSNATAYQWYNVNNTNVVLGTDSFYVPSVAGNYYCLITDTAGCQSPSNVVGITTNLNQQNLMHLKNPSIIYDLTNGTLVINNNDKQVALSISNYMGQCLMKKQLAIGKTVIGVNEWSSGPYVVKFETQIGIGVFNFVK